VDHALHRPRAADRGPAAAVILLTLPVFAFVELLVWLPLLANQRIRAAGGQPAKQVNPPSLRLKT
jgi:hypothetical protein